MSEEELTDPTSVYAWGNDTFGQLGLGKKTERAYSYPVLCTFDILIAQVSCGEEHSAFRTVEGLVYTMGSNADGRLGLNDHSLKLVSTPSFVTDLSDVKVTFISCGSSHTAALTAGGQVFTWGLGSSGALGTGNSLSHWRPHLLVLADEPSVESVSCGGRHTALVTSESLGSKKLYLCGAGDAGQLGSGRRDSNLLPRILPFSETIEQVACGSLHTLFRTAANRVFAMGANSFGQLGNGSKRSAMEPVLVAGLDGLRIKQVACWSFSAAVTVEGGLYLWGTGTFGEFLVPKRVKTTNEVTEVAVGSSFGIVLDRAGLLWSWGSNSGGELGIGDSESRESPTAILTLQGKPIRQVACGATFAIALGEDISAQRTQKINFERRKPTDLSVASLRSSVSDVETQSHSRLFRLYQSELDARKMLELELFKEQQVKLTYMKQVENLTLESQDLRDAVRKAETDLAQTQADIAWHSQNSVQLSTKNKGLADRLKDVSVVEQKLEDAQLALSTSEKAKRRLEDLLEAANARVTELEQALTRANKELAEAKTGLRRAEGELEVLQQTVTDEKRRGDHTAVEAEMAIEGLSRRQEELEQEWTARLSEQSMKIQTQEEVIRDLRNRLQQSTASNSRLEAEVTRLESKVTSLSRDLSDRNARVNSLEATVERQDVKNKALVEALEKEVKERASSLRRAKDVLATSDISRISPLSLSPSLDGDKPSVTDKYSPAEQPSHFLQNRLSLEARLSAFERKLNLSQREPPL